MSESSAMRAVSSVIDDCRRLAERLRLDAVGVVIGPEPDRHVTWWAAPDGPPLPSRLDDVVAGADPARLEEVGEPVGVGLELGEGDDAVPHLDGGLVRNGVDGVFEEVGDVEGHDARLEHVSLFR